MTTTTNGVEKKERGEMMVSISAPRIYMVPIKIVGTAPLVQNAFPKKARDMMKAAQMAGSQGKKGKKREPKDFMQCYEQSKHISEEGWIGIPAGAFRAAMVDACRLVGFKMTHAKLGVFVEADGNGLDDGMPLVRITDGEPTYVEHPVRNDSGVADIRARAMWREWGATVRVLYDADMFSANDVINLMTRVGLQVGIGEGRPNSKNSTGVGWGTFAVQVDPFDVEVA